MSKIALINDTHCGARNSSDVFMQYQQKFYDEVFFPYLIENKITEIIHLGDYYEHRKFVNFKALEHNRKVFLQRLREYNIHMHIIPGNHDVFYKNTNELCSLKELMGHYTDCVTIHMKPTVLPFGSFRFGVIPWINNENYSETMEFIKTCRAPIIGGHFEFSGFEMYKGIPNPHGMDTSAFDRFEAVLSGHFHTKSSRGNIHYLGSQMEFTWGDCDDAKYFHVLDTRTRELSPIRNPHTLHEKIVYNDDKTDYNSIDVTQYDSKFVKVIVEKKTDYFGFDRFIDRLSQRPLHEMKIAESFSEFLGESVEDDDIELDDTQVLLDSYVDAVETEADKEKLKTLLRGLYVEAQNTELV
jgi:DNA repair exonuclease SbcCD nuclease subunit